MVKPCFRTSMIAGLCGFNQYLKSDKNKLLDTLFKCYQETYNPTDIEYINEEQMFEDLLNKSENLKEKFNIYKNTKIENNEQLNDIVNDCLEFINIEKEKDIYNDDDVILMTKYVNKTFNCSYGTTNESKTIDKLKDEYNIIVTNNNDETYTKEFSNFKVTGHIDGMANFNDEKVLIEVKNRRNRLFKEVVQYEEIQVLFYLNLTGLQKAILIEQYKNKIHINEYNIQNKRLYVDCINRLNQLSEFYELIDNDKKLRNEIFINKNFDFLTMYLFWF